MTVIDDNFDGSVEELVTEANRALAGVTSSDRRVAPAVDVRTVRWYTSSGLLDPPEREGRRARYGGRHLQRLVAIRRLQADGWSLAGIHRLLEAADDDHLARLAGGEPPAAPDAFWSARPAPPAADPTGLAHPAGRAGTTVVLAPGVRLVLDDPVPDDRLAELVAAARPLLDALARPDHTPDDRPPRRRPA